MQDPNPENIMGQKRVSHSVEWQVNVGYALLGLLGLYLAWKLVGGSSTSESDDEPDPLEDATEIGFEAAQEVTRRA